MDPGANSLGPPLLNGCCHEAERAQRVGLGLEGLRNSLPDKYHQHMSSVIEQVHQSAHLLRDLADKSQVHISRIPIVIDYLNVVLPCLSKTLRDITGFFEDRKYSRDDRWRRMYHIMAQEMPGTSLSARFIMYNQFLASLQNLLTKSPIFDFNGLESLRTRILQLRNVLEAPPSPIELGSLIRQRDAMGFWEHETDSHWAESIFTQPLPSRTELEKPGRSNSVAFGPLHRVGHLNISPDVKILIKRSFDNDRLSVTFFLETFNEAPYLLIRTVTGGQTWVSMHGAHELCIHRDNGHTLSFTRWSKTEHKSKLWASLSFITWEELVLFWCTFVGLKTWSPATINVGPSELTIRRETRLFQAEIIDDGYEHCLAVFEDAKIGRKRLHASVWDGPLKSCPVWTAFLPEDAATTSWIVRKGAYRVWIRDIQPYVFCQRYRAHKQRKGKTGSFELCFVHSRGAAKFKELFEAPEPTIATSDSEESVIAGPSGHN